jgi:hypothetical protein
MEASDFFLQNLPKILLKTAVSDDYYYFIFFAIFQVKLFFFCKILETENTYPPHPPSPQKLNISSLIFIHVDGMAFNRKVIGCSANKFKN